MTSIELTSTDSWTIVSTFTSLSQVYQKKVVTARKELRIRNYFAEEISVIGDLGIDK